MGTPGIPVGITIAIQHQQHQQQQQQQYQHQQYDHHGSGSSSNSSSNSSSCDNNEYNNNNNNNNNNVSIGLHDSGPSKQQQQQRKKKTTTTTIKRKSTNKGKESKDHRNSSRSSINDNNKDKNSNRYKKPISSFSIFVEGSAVYLLCLILPTVLGGLLHFYDVYRFETTTTTTQTQQHQYMLSSIITSSKAWAMVQTKARDIAKPYCTATAAGDTGSNLNNNWIVDPLTPAATPAFTPNPVTWTTTTTTMSRSSSTFARYLYPTTMDDESIVVEEQDAGDAANIKSQATTLSQRLSEQTYAYLSTCLHWAGLCPADEDNDNDNNSNKRRKQRSVLSDDTASWKKDAVTVAVCSLILALIRLCIVQWTVPLDGDEFSSEQLVALVRCKSIHLLSPDYSLTPRPAIANNHNDNDNKGGRPTLGGISSVGDGGGTAEDAIRNHHHKGGQSIDLSFPALPLTPMLHNSTAAIGGNKDNVVDNAIGYRRPMQPLPDGGGGSGGVTLGAAYNVVGNILHRNNDSSQNLGLGIDSSERVHEDDDYDFGLLFRGSGGGVVGDTSRNQPSPTHPFGQPILSLSPPAAGTQDVSLLDDDDDDWNIDNGSDHSKIHPSLLKHALMLKQQQQQMIASTQTTTVKSPLRGHGRSQGGNALNTGSDDGGNGAADTLSSGDRGGIGGDATSPGTPTRLYAAPRYATALFRLLWSTVAIVLALYYFRDADFWPWYTFGHGHTKNCWDLSGGLTVGMDSDFDQRNVALKRYFLGQASYHWHSGFFHILSTLVLVLHPKHHAPHRFRAMQTTNVAYVGSMAHHLLGVIMIGVAYVFSSFRRLCAIGMFAFDSSSWFMHLLQICINAPPDSKFRRPIVISRLYWLAVLPSFVITRCFIWPVIWYSATVESKEWLYQLERTLWPGSAAILMGAFHVFMVLVLAVTAVYFRRLVRHPHLKGILQA